MLMQTVWILVSLGVLFVGAESLVRGAAALAERAGLSRLAVGLTVVAFGTSTPELVVSIDAARSGLGDIALGNVIGSNSFNIGVILGISALVVPLTVHRQVLRFDGPIALAVALSLPLFLLDGRIGRLDAAIFCTAMIAYTWMNVVLARREVAAGAGEIVADESEPTEQSAARSVTADVVRLVVGLLLLVLGSRLLVVNATELAQGLGVSEAVIGLTIVAAGTSMPELATSVVAAIRGQTDIAVGNVIGSNVFNIIGILGISALVAPLSAPGISTLDLAFMVGLTALLLPMLITGRRLHRLEGAALLALYGVYLVLLWPS